MNCTARLLPYEKTGAFSGLVLDYLNGVDEVKPMFSHAVSLDGLKKAIEARKAVPVDRLALQQVFRDLYASGATEAQQRHISAISSPDTFTICTAHQPNIFTGYLYFVYKILHVVRIAEELKHAMPGHDFVPVYYMGSEDNDLEELGQVKVDGVKRVWQTQQEGAVGRMKVDKALLAMITELEGQLGVKKYGADVIALLRSAYTEGRSMADATKALVDSLFGTFGLLVLNADDARLKKAMVQVFRDDLTTHTPHALVTAAGEKMEHRYKVQVNPREINLFYMVDGIRERIIETNGQYSTESGAIRMSREEILLLLDEHPECFSPNVVLRALYQETVMPNIAFVGGGSEIAYWLEMKAMFDHFGVPFPVLVLRNSFLVTGEAEEKKLASYGLKVEDLFQGEFGLVDQYVRMHSDKVLDVDAEREKTSELFKGLKAKASAIDPTLVQHLEALETRFSKQLDSAEKKLVRAEKRKYGTGKDQVLKVRAKLFPNNSLQERVDNFMPYYADYGPGFIDALYTNSPSLDQQFIILTINN